MLLHKHLNTGIRDTGLVDREGGPWGSPDFRSHIGRYTGWVWTPNMKIELGHGTRTEEHRSLA